MLHTARHLSLACVEILVQLDKSELPRDYVWSWAELRVTPSNLEWSDLSHVSSCQAAGQAWVDTAGQLAIQVPSVVIPEEFNVLLNPPHQEYAALVWSQQRAFRFDPRLVAAATRTLSAEAPSNQTSHDNRRARNHEPKQWDSCLEPHADTP